MTRGLIERKASVFGQEEWLSLPWAGIEKTTQQKLCDLGLRLSILTERTDVLTATATPAESDVKTLLTDISQLEQEIRAGIEISTTYSENEVMVYHPKATRLTTLHEWCDKSYSARCAFNNGLLLACGDLTDSLGILSEHWCHELPGVYSGSDEALCDPTRMETAKSILHDAEDCLSECLGPGIIIRVSWALQVASSHFAINGPDLAYSQYLLESLRSQKLRSAAAVIRS